MRRYAQPADKRLFLKTVELLSHINPDWVPRLKREGITPRGLAERFLRASEGVSPLVGGTDGMFRLRLALAAGELDQDLALMFGYPSLN